MGRDKFKIMWQNDEIAEVLFTANDFKVTQNSNHVKKVFYTPEEEVTRDDVIDFLKYQIFDEHNARAPQILAELGVNSYDLWKIAEKTRAISCRNNYWIKFEGDEFDYDRDIKTRKFLLMG